jgi:hypothetical protein
MAVIPGSRRFPSSRPERGLLPTAFCGPNFAVGGLGEIAAKLLIYNILSM